MVKEDLLLYRQIPKCYAKKKYKQGIRIADKILANEGSPMCHKLMAWKGLFWGLLGRPDTGLKLVEKALKKNSKSSLCWHVYGKLLTMMGEFQRAIDCYKSAIATAPENAGIAMDLAWAQVQVGNVEGFKNITGDVLKWMPQSRQSWVAYAVASHLSGDASSALEILSCFTEAVNQHIIRLSPWENSELTLYQARLLKETGNDNQALFHLLENRHKIHDTITLNETLSELYLRTGRYQEAVTVLQSLLKTNRNKRNYYNSLFAALHLNTDSAKAQILETFCDEFPNDHIPKMVFFEYVTGKKFIHSFATYVKAQLAKGSLNLFQYIKFLMSNDLKKDYMKSFLTKHHSVFFKKVKACPGVRDLENELLANIACTANIYDFEKDHLQALERINKALSINPLVTELYVLKAKFLKHMMNYTEACKALEKAQRIDPQDRWLEIKLVKYVMRTDLLDLADKTLSEVYRHGGREEIAEMLWYIFEKAASYKRMGKLHEALEICRVMERTVVNMKNSLFELHSSCLQNLSLNAYKDFVVAGENIRKNKYYLKCAALAVEVAIQLQDLKFQEHKKARRVKARFSMDKVATPGKLGRLRHVEDDESDSDSDVAPPKGDPDYFQNFLLSIRHFLRHLQTYEAHKIETQVLSFEVYRRFRRPLLMVQSLLKARRIDKHHHLLLVPMVHLHQSLKKWEAKDAIPQKKLTVLQEMGKKGLWKNRSMEEITNIFLRKHSKDLRYMLEGAKALYKLYPSKREEAVKLACYTGEGAKHLDVPMCCKVLDELRTGTFGVCNAEAEVYRRKCADLFKFTTAFDIDEMKKMRQQDLIRTFNNREPVVVLHPDKDG